MDVLLLGGIEIHHEGRRIHAGQRRERGLLALLMLELGAVVSLDRLASMLWDEDPPAGYREAIYVHVARLRRRLPVGEDLRIITGHGGYAADGDPQTVDAHRFQTLLDQARTATDPAQRSQRLRLALALWRGPALADALTDRTRERVTARLVELRRAATEDLYQTELDRGRHREVIAELTATATATDHWPNERLTAQLMQALRQTGRQTDALEVYQAHRIRLAEQYGTDPGDALARLHAEILRGDPTTGTAPRPPQPDGRRPAIGPRRYPLAAHEPARRPFRIPRLLPADVPWFVGREPQLGEARRLLGDAAERARTLLVIGPAGVGKTTFATRLAHVVRHEYPDGQLHIDLQGFDATAPLDPVTALRRLLEALGVPPRRIPHTTQARAALYRDVLAGRRVLVVLDNAANPAQVRPLLAPSADCGSVVTSRDQMLGLVAIDDARLLTLDVFTLPEARALLVGRLGPDRVATSAAAVDDIISACARLPLALSIVASRAMAYPAFDLESFAAELRDAGDALTMCASPDAVVDVRTVFSWSYRALDQDSARLFRLLGLHPGPDIGRPAVASLAGASMNSVRAMLGRLTAAHLITEHAPGRYRGHDLLRAYARELAHEQDSDIDRREALQRILDHYLHTAYGAERRLEPHRRSIPLADCHPDVRPERFDDDEAAMAWLSVEYPVLRAAVDAAVRAGFDRQAAQIPWAMQTYFDRSGRWREWLAVQQIGLRAAQRINNDVVQARAHTGLAWVNARLDDTEAVEDHLRHALRLYDKLRDRIGQAYVHLCLGWIFEPRELYRPALEHAVQALALYREAGCVDGQAMALNNVGWYEAQLGEYDQALAHCRHALRQLRANGNRTWQARTWDSLGYIHHRLGQYRRAINCYEAALRLFGELGNQHYQTKVLVRLAETQHATGDHEAARRSRHRALGILDEIAHPDADRVRELLTAPRPA